MQVLTEVLEAGVPSVGDSVIRGTGSWQHQGNSTLCWTQDTTSPSRLEQAKPGASPQTPRELKARGSTFPQLAHWPREGPSPGCGASPGPAGPQGRSPEPAELANLTHLRGQPDSTMRGSENTPLTHQLPEALPTALFSPDVVWRPSIFRCTQGLPLSSTNS